MYEVSVGSERPFPSPDESILLDRLPDDGFEGGWRVFLTHHAAIAVSLTDWQKKKVSVSVTIWDDDDFSVYVDEFCDLSEQQKFEVSCWLACLIHDEVMSCQN